MKNKRRKMPATKRGGSAKLATKNGESAKKRGGNFGGKRTEGRRQKAEGREDRASYEGLQKDIRNLKTPKIEVWQNQYAHKNYTISLDIPEFTCICPKTGLPDFATICIEYSPEEFCVELKSFKMYTISFRNVGIFHEHLINKILEDFVKSVKPRWVKINGIFNPRGGITTTVSAEYKAK